MLTADGDLPPNVRRGHYYGPRWAQSEGETRTAGLISEVLRGGWTTRLGLFESVFAPDAEFGDLLTDIDEEGRARELIVAFPDSRYASRSGELRVSRSFEGETRRHGVHIAAKGRLQRRRYGGEDVIDAGIVQMGAGQMMPRPEFEFGEQSRDEVEQGTFGVAYELQWKNVGEMSVGVQKTRYTKSVETPEGELPETRAQPTLVNATATVYATETLALYGSYTEGLEESPVAPDNAVNRNEAAPALLTEQYDAGIRWTLTRDLRLIAGVFHIEKPYFDLDQNGFFRLLGDVEHRGAELSLAGSPVKNLTVVAGARFLDAEVTGPIVEAGLIGRKPVGSAKTYGIASVDYRFAETGVSMDLVAEAISGRIANTANTLETPGRAVLHLGGRYRFRMFDKPATFRAQVQNIFDKYGWNVIPGGIYVFNAQRRFTATLAVDL
jgi:iron complex outermembrane receptor protein